MSIKEYYRRKRILRILSLQNSSDKDILSSEPGGKLFSGHAFLWFAFFCFAAFIFGSILSGVSKSLPSVLVEILWGLALLLSVEAADFAWLLSYEQVEVVVRAGAVLLFFLISGGALALRASTRAKEGASKWMQSFGSNLIARRDEINRKMRYRLPVTGPESGENWRLMAEESPRGNIWAEREYPEAAAFCAGIGKEWSLPKSGETLSRLQPHPTLQRSFSVWIEGGKTASQLDPQPQTSGKSFVSSGEKDHRHVLCVREP